MSSCETGSSCRLVLLVTVIFARTAFRMGVIKSVGVFLSGIQASLGESATGIGVALGVFSACISCPAPLLGYFYSFLPSSLRRMMLIGGPFLSSLGVILASFAVDYMQFATCLALSGVGFSFMVMCVLLELSEQAGTHFGFYLSIGTTGFAVGMSVIPLLGEFLMNVYGWRGAMLILGGLMGNIMPLTAAIRPKVPASSQSEATKEENRTDEETIPLSGDVSKSNKEKEEIFANYDVLCEVNCGKSEGSYKASSMQNPHTSDEIEMPCEHSDYISDERRGSLSGSRANKLQLRNSNPLQTESTWAMVTNALRSSQFYKNPSLTLFLAAVGSYGMAHGAWHAFLLPRAVESGMTIYFAILVTVCVAVANITGRIVIAVLTEKTSRLHEIHLSLTLLDALTVLCDVLIFRSAAIYVTSILSSFTMAGRGVMTAVMIRQLASPDCRFVALGFGEFQFGVGGFVGTYVAGFAADRFGGFNSSYVVVIGCEVLVFFLVLFSRFKLN